MFIILCLLKTYASFCPIHTHPVSNSTLITNLHVIKTFPNFTLFKNQAQALTYFLDPQVPHRVDILRHEIHVTPPTPPPASTSSSSQILPYIKPSVFTPASIPDTHPSSETHLWEVIPPTWNPDGTTLTTTWRRVSYAPRSEWRKSLPTSLPPPRNPLTLLVEERMSDLNARFKDNIKNNATLFSQGLSYNKSDREITSQLEPCKGNLLSFYFKITHLS